MDINISIQSVISVIGYSRKNTSANQTQQLRKSLPSQVKIIYQTEFGDKKVTLPTTHKDIKVIGVWSDSDGDVWVTFNRKIAGSTRHQVKEIMTRKVRCYVPKIEGKYANGTSPELIIETR